VPTWLAVALAVLAVALAVLVVALVGVVLLADRPAERAVLLIAAVRDQRTAPRLAPTPRRVRWPPPPGLADPR
jgi:hypothetical protein